jgi:hypothetical protein
MKTILISLAILTIGISIYHLSNNVDLDILRQMLTMKDVKDVPLNDIQSIGAPGDPDGVPVDGGIITVLGGAILYGAKHLQNRKKR